MTVGREVVLYAYETGEEDRRPIKAIDNGDGTYSLSTIADGKSVVSSQGNLLDHSGEITANNTSQEVMPANANRKYLLIQNVSAIALWIGFNTDANQDQPSIKLLADGSFDMEGTFICTQSISIIGSTAGSSFTAKEGVIA